VESGGGDGEDGVGSVISVGRDGGVFKVTARCTVGVVGRDGGVNGDGGVGAVSICVGSYDDEVGINGSVGAVGSFGGDGCVVIGEGGVGGDSNLCTAGGLRTVGGNVDGDGNVSIVGSYGGDGCLRC